MFTGLFMHSGWIETSIKLVVAEDQKQAQDYLGEQFELQWGTYNDNDTKSGYPEIPWIEWEVDFPR